MTCPTCQGYGVGKADPPSFCPTCYATGQEPSAAPPDLVAARLRVRAGVLLECVQSRTAGARITVALAARTLAAALRAHGTPTPEHDTRARLMVRILLSYDQDPRPFLEWTREHLSAHARIEMVGRTVSYVPEIDALVGLMGERHASR